MIKLYLDENVPESIAQALKLRGYNVVTASSIGKKGLTDKEQLHFAASEKRIIFTFNTGDYCELHTEFLSEGKTHEGIILSKQLPVGIIIKGLINICSMLKPDKMRNNIFWLSDWINK